jgi:hypothetical protein
MNHKHIKKYQFQWANPWILIFYIPIAQPSKTLLTIWSSVNKILFCRSHFNDTLIRQIIKCDATVTLSQSNRLFDAYCRYIIIKITRCHLQSLTQNTNIDQNDHIFHSTSVTYANVTYTSASTFSARSKLPRSYPISYTLTLSSQSATNTSPYRKENPLLPQPQQTVTKTIMHFFETHQIFDNLNQTKI